MTTVTRIGNARYCVLGILGEGAQGTTYDALDEREGRTVAIKRFDVRGARAWKDIELAEREIRVLASLDHTLVPRYLGHFEEDGALYLVMEKIEGETLDAIRRRQGEVSEAEVRRFLDSAASALSYLHGRERPVVHRDIKPRNVVRRADGSYVFVDFGAVSERVARPGASTVVGTIGYMAPEQFQGRAMPASDVYAVGATALAALTGLEPETLVHHGLRVGVREALAGRASEAMIATLESMLEPDPEKRAPSVAAALTHPGHRAQVGIAGANLRPPGPSTAMAPVAPTEEDAQVKSLRRLLWTLWGLSWMIVPAALGPLGLGRLIPVVMFGALAGLLVLQWHKGALLRAGLRAIQGKTQVPQLAVQTRISVAPPLPNSQLRVEGAVIQNHSAGTEVREPIGPDLPEQEDGSEFEAPQTGTHTPSRRL